MKYDETNESGPVTVDSIYMAAPLLVAQPMIHSRFLRYLSADVATENKKIHPAKGISKSRLPRILELLCCLDVVSRMHCWYMYSGGAANLTNLRPNPIVGFV